MLRINRMKSSKRQWKAFNPAHKGALWIHEYKKDSVFRIDSSGIFYTNLIMNHLKRMHDKWNSDDNPCFFVTKKEVNDLLNLDIEAV